MDRPRVGGQSRGARSRALGDVLGGAPSERTLAYRGVLVRRPLAEDSATLAFFAAMTKVHIIGLPSSGKTTLAAGLASSFRVAHHDLDAVAFLDERWTSRPIADRDQLVAQILASPGFVTEGGFVGWVTPLLAARTASFGSIPLFGF